MPVAPGQMALPSAERIRSLINATGGQIRNDDGDVIYASSAFTAIHAASDGVKRVHIPGKGRLIDAMTGEEFPGNESYVDVRMAKGDTLLMRIERDRET